MGGTGDDYPWHWSVYRWLEGENATIEVIAGLKLCAELRPDAVFLDIKLPDKDGVSLATRLAAAV
jgi:DNA-binding LytR/AlgR family response regulator